MFVRVTCDKQLGDGAPSNQENGANNMGLLHYSEDSTSDEDPAQQERRGHQHLGRTDGAVRRDGRHRLLLRTGVPVQVLLFVGFSSFPGL